MRAAFGVIAAAACVVAGGCTDPQRSAGGQGSAPSAPASAGVRSSGASPAAKAAGPRSIAETIRSQLASCTRVSRGLFKTDDDPKAPATIPICDKGGAVWWRADLDVDCDGKPTARCNKKADPDFQPQTSAVASNGDFLEAETLPYVVIPQRSARFDHEAAGVMLGAVVMVVYRDKVEYGVFADRGPADIIGEASYAMAKRLGIDPDPRTGGTDEEVLYVAFKGKGAVPARLEDHDEAVRIGQRLASTVFELR